MARRASTLLAALAYLGLSVIPYWGFWAAGGTGIAGKGGDPAAGAWFLDWTSYALLHGHNPLVTDWGNYPFGVNGITNISMPLLGMLAMPATLASGAFAATTLLFTLAFPLSSLSCFLLVSRWVRWWPAARSIGTAAAVTAAGLGYPVWQAAAGMRFKSPGGRFIVPAADQQTIMERALTQLAAGQPPPMTRAMRSGLRAQLRSWGVREILVRPAGKRPALVMPFFQWLLGRPPDVSSGGISAWQWNGEAWP